MSAGSERAKLMRPYEHPYRTLLPRLVAGTTGDRVRVASPVLLWLAGALAMVTGANLVGALAWVCAWIALLFVIAWLIGGVRHVVALTRPWKRTSELGSVRARRPHAGLRDPDVVHDEFAVTAEDDGYLVVWRFRPLRAGAAPAPDTVLVPGRPQYKADVVEQQSFDPRDTAVAAGQLDDLQQRAAELEANAARKALVARELRCSDEEREIEARGTAAALQRITGQRSRRD